MQYCNYVKLKLSFIFKILIAQSFLNLPNWIDYFHMHFFFQLLDFNWIKMKFNSVNRMRDQNENIFDDLCICTAENLFYCCRTLMCNQFEMKWNQIVRGFLKPKNFCCNNKSSKFANKHFSFKLLILWNE